MENNLITSLATFLDRDEKEIEDLIVTVDFKDLMKLTKAVRDSNEKQAVNIMHGYGL